MAPCAVLGWIFYYQAVPHHAGAGLDGVRHSGPRRISAAIPACCWTVPRFTAVLNANPWLAGRAAAFPSVGVSSVYAAARNCPFAMLPLVGELRAVSVPEPGGIAGCAVALGGRPRPHRADRRRDRLRAATPFTLGSGQNSFLSAALATAGVWFMAGRPRRVGGSAGPAGVQAATGDPDPGRPGRRAGVARDDGSRAHCRCAALRQPGGARHRAVAGPGCICFSAAIPAFHQWIRPGPPCTARACSPARDWPACRKTGRACCRPSPSSRGAWQRLCRVQQARCGSQDTARDPAVRDDRGGAACRQLRRRHAGRGVHAECLYGGRTGPARFETLLSVGRVWCSPVVPATVRHPSRRRHAPCLSPA